MPDETFRTVEKSKKPEETRPRRQALCCQWSRSRSPARPRLTPPELPFDAPKLQTVMSWHNRFDDLPEHRWARETIVAATAGIWTSWTRQCLSEAVAFKSCGAVTALDALILRALARAALRIPAGPMLTWDFVFHRRPPITGGAGALPDHSISRIQPGPHIIPWRPLLAASSLHASRRGTLFG